MRVRGDIGGTARTSRQPGTHSIMIGRHFHGPISRCLANERIMKAMNLMGAGDSRQLRDCMCDCTNWHRARVTDTSRTPSTLSVVMAPDR